MHQRLDGRDGRWTHLHPMAVSVLASDAATDLAQQEDPGDASVITWECPVVGSLGIPPRCATPGPAGCVEFCGVGCDRAGSGWCKLNVVGWAALLVPGATLGLVGARLGGASVMGGAAVGGVAAWALALVVDTVRWRASDICFSCPDVPLAALDRVVGELQAGGVDASIEVGMHGSDAEETVFQIRSRMRFRSIVERRLAELNTP